MSGRIGLAVAWSRGDDPQRRTPLEACALAITFVKAAGFEPSWVSMKSEATYWRYPGRLGVLRIATHAKGGRNADMRDGPTLVSITFPEGQVGKDGRMRATLEHIENHVANAIGLYLIRAKDCPHAP